ncbi:hypothetical protein D3C72_1085610 [compost metagenome]
MARQPGQHPVEQGRQQQRRRQQQACQQAERAGQTVAQHATAQGQQKQQAGHHGLAPQPRPLGQPPRLRLRQRQQRQPRRTQHTAQTRQQRPQHAHQHAHQPPPGGQAQRPGDLGAIQAAQAGGHIGQQPRSQPVTTGHAGQTAQHREQPQLQHQGAQQGLQADATGAQVANQAAPLFQCQTDCGMGNEQADDERQQAKGGQVEVEAVGQPLQAAIVLPGLQLKVRRDIRRQRPRRGSHQQARQLPGGMQQRLGVADIDHDHPWGQRWL